MSTNGLTERDLVLIGGVVEKIVKKEIKDNNVVFKKEIMQEVKSEIRSAITENNDVLKREIRDEVHSLISASETRLSAKIDTLRDEITDVINDGILPQIADLQLKLA